MSEYFQVIICHTLDETNNVLKELGQRVYFVNPLVIGGDPSRVIYSITYLGE